MKKPVIWLVGSTWASLVQVGQDTRPRNPPSASVFPCQPLAYSNSLPVCCVVLGNLVRLRDRYGL